jgi:hypothetical protein
MPASADTVEKSSPSSGPSSALQSSSGASPPPTPGALATLSASALSWVALIVIVVAWFKGMILGAPWWGPLLALILISMPGGVLVGVTKSVAEAVLSKIPGGKQ